MPLTLTSLHEQGIKKIIQVNPPISDPLEKLQSSIPSLQRKLQEANLEDKICIKRHSIALQTKNTTLPLYQGYILYYLSLQSSFQRKKVTIFCATQPKKIKTQITLTSIPVRNGTLLPAINRHPKPQEPQPPTTIAYSPDKHLLLVHQ